jgi:2-hydroxychromene-2-carboxylate isomerase
MPDTDKSVIEFLYDFGSPNAYLVHRAIANDMRSNFRYTPVLLGGIFKATGNQSPMQAYGHIAAKRSYDMLEMHRFMARHDINGFKMNPFFPVNTLAIMRGAVAAERLGCAEAYIEAMMAGMWEHGLKLDDPAVVDAALVAAGLPATELLAASADPEVKARLVANTEAAVARGVFGIPSFFVGEDLYFGKDRLRDVIEAAQ